MTTWTWRLAQPMKGERFGHPHFALFRDGKEQGEVSFIEQPPRMAAAMDRFVAVLSEMAD